MFLLTEKNILLLSTVVASFFGSIVVYLGIENFIPKMRDAGLGGFDLNKKGSLLETKEKIPESLGLIPGAFFIFTLIIMQTIFINVNLTPYILTISLMLFLGFADDVLNFRWAYKLVIPFICMLPMLVEYDGGSTIFIKHIMQLNTGSLIFFLIGALIIFSINAINIHAGINGIEVGQSISIAAFLLSIILKNADDMNSIVAAIILIVFLAYSLPLFIFNRHPSRVFVGDTYCYFAGATLGASAILSNRIVDFGLLLIPQVINFILSLPQLLGFITCPRHRLPRFDPLDGKLHAVWPDHYTLINLFLKLSGPMDEATLTNTMLLLQNAFGLVGIYMSQYIRLE